MPDLTPNDLLGLAELLRLRAADKRGMTSIMPDHVPVMLTRDDCRALAALLLAESIRRREATDSAERPAATDWPSDNPTRPSAHL